MFGSLGHTIITTAPVMHGLCIIVSTISYLNTINNVFSTGTLAITCLMVGDAQTEYIDSNPSLCEQVKQNETNGKNITTELDLAECPAAHDVVFTITFITGLIMVKK